MPVSRQRLGCSSLALRTPGLGGGVAAQLLPSVQRRNSERKACCSAQTRQRWTPGQGCSEHGNLIFFSGPFSHLADMQGTHRSASDAEAIIAN